MKLNTAGCKYSRITTAVSRQDIKMIHKKSIITLHEIPLARRSFIE